MGNYELFFLYYGSDIMTIGYNYRKFLTTLGKSAHGRSPSIALYGLHGSSESESQYLSAGLLVEYHTNGSNRLLRQVIVGL